MLIDARRLLPQVGPAEAGEIERVAGRGRDVREAAAAVAPRARERGQAGERAVGDRRAEVALRAHAGAQERGLGRGELAAEPRDRRRVDAADLAAALDGVVAEAREQVVVADA